MSEGGSLHSALRMQMMKGGDDGGWRGDDGMMMEGGDDGMVEGRLMEGGDGGGWT